jgi:hypothetical protein
MALPQKAASRQNKNNWLADGEGGAKAVLLM